MDKAPNRFKAAQKARLAASKPPAKMSIVDVENKFFEKLQEKHIFNKQNVRRLFMTYDKNGDGTLDLGEMVHMIGTFLNGIPSSLIMDLVRRYDVDGDGVINLQEFQAMLMSRQSNDPKDWVTCERLTTGNRDREMRDVSSSAENARDKDEWCVSEGEESSVISSERFYVEDARPSSAAAREAQKRTEHLGKMLMQGLRSSLVAKAREQIALGAVSKENRFMQKQSMLIDDVASDILLREFLPFIRKKTQSDPGVVRYDNFARIVQKFSPPGAAAPRTSTIQHLFALCRKAGDIEDMADPVLLAGLVFGKGGTYINKFGFAQNLNAHSSTGRPEVSLVLA